MAVRMAPAQQRNITYMNTITQKARGQPPSIRPIDLVSGTRSKPMQILCLGYSRTGTFSLFTALKMLGYHPYHMAEAVKNADVDLVCWADGVESKILGKGKEWGKEEFDKLTGHCDAILDVPCILFVEELIKAYPEAKVILTERPVQGWLKSMKNSIGEVFSWRRWKYVAWADPDLARPLYNFVGRTLTNLVFNGGDFSENSKTAEHYLEHNKRVRKACPPERLLEFKLGSGWEPLCEFLGKEVPGCPYPNVNDKEMFIGVNKAVMNRATVYAVQKVLTWTGGVAAVAGAAWYWTRLRS